MRAVMLVVAMLAACGAPQPKPPTDKGPASSAEERDDCTTDDDCTLVEACCGCANGGRKVGLRVDAVAAYDKGRADRCKAVSCPAVVSDHPSCNAEASCKKGHCRPQPHMTLGPAPTDSTPATPLPPTP